MDQGLLQGLTEGLRSGVASYADAADKKYRRDVEAKKIAKEEEDRQERLGLLREQRENEKIKLGMTKDESGNWVPDPESFILKKQKAELKAAENKGLLDAANLAKTQAETKKITNETSGIGGKAPTQKLSAGAAENLAGSEMALAALSDAKNLSDQNKDVFGKGIGLMGTAASTFGVGNLGTKAASVDADLMSKAQTIGKYLEGGKLAESDINRYLKMLPNRTDKPEVVANKVATLERLVQQKYNADLKNYQNAGFNVGEAKPINVGAGLLKNNQEDPQIAAYAKQYGLDYNKAKAIIDKRRGM